MLYIAVQYAITDYIGFMEYFEPFLKKVEYMVKTAGSAKDYIVTKNM